MDNSKIGSIEGSIIKNISKGDKVRRDAFQQIKFYNENLIIAQDLNYISTIERGLYQNAVLSVKIILRHIFQDINSIEYARFIMGDLPCILSQKKLNINEFFERSHTELLERENEGFCNMEIPFIADMLPVFSDQLSDYTRMNKFRNFHDFEYEMI